MKTTLSSSEIYKRFGYWCEVDQKKAKNIPNYEPTMRPGQHNKKLDKVFVIPRDYIPEVINQRNVLASDFVTVYHRTHKGKKLKEVNFVDHSKHFDKEKNICKCNNENQKEICKLDEDGYILVNYRNIENIPKQLLEHKNIKCLDPDLELAIKLKEANQKLYYDKLGNRKKRSYNCDSPYGKTRGIPEYE